MHKIPSRRSRQWKRLYSHRFVSSVQALGNNHKSTNDTSVLLKSLRGHRVLVSSMPKQLVFLAHPMILSLSPERPRAVAFRRRKGRQKPHRRDIYNDHRDTLRMRGSLQQRVVTSGQCEVTSLDCRTFSEPPVGCQGYCPADDPRHSSANPQSCLQARALTAFSTTNHTAHITVFLYEGKRLRAHHSSQCL